MSQHISETVEAVFEAVADLAPEVRAGLPGRRVAQGDTNPTGDTQMAADAYADDRLLDRMEAIDGVGEYASEERESVVDCGEGLSVAADPLDGSSNLRSNNAMGTIVGVYDAPLPAPGSDLVAAAYVLYGPITTMVAAREGEVTEAVVHDGEREVVDDVTVPEDPTVYGFGGRVPDWPDDFASFAEAVQADESIKLRYGGAMIGDVNQVVTYGGVFAYPALESAPEGKLRLLFEAAPVAHVVETAGGRSSDGERSLLEVEPDGLHDRVPVHLGSPDLIDRLEAALG